MRGVIAQPQIARHIEQIDSAADRRGRDPNLKSPRGEAMRILLHLFGRDEARRLVAFNAWGRFIKEVKRGSN
jgi:ATP-dependent DNA helicase RecG